jgi:hypothetical protein
MGVILTLDFGFVAYCCFGVSEIVRSIILNDTQATPLGWNLKTFISFGLNPLENFICK